MDTATIAPRSTRLSREEIARLEQLVLTNHCKNSDSPKNLRIFGPGVKEHFKGADAAEKAAALATELRGTGRWHIQDSGGFVVVSSEHFEKYVITDVWELLQTGKGQEAA